MRSIQYRAVKFSPSSETYMLATTDSKTSLSVVKELPLDFVELLLLWKRF